MSNNLKDADSDTDDDEWGETIGTLTVIDGVKTFIVDKNAHLHYSEEQLQRYMESFNKVFKCQIMQKIELSPHTPCLNGKYLLTCVLPPNGDMPRQMPHSTTRVWSTVERTLTPYKYKTIYKDVNVRF